MGGSSLTSSWGHYEEAGEGVTVMLTGMNVVFVGVLVVWIFRSLYAVEIAPRLAKISHRRSTHNSKHAWAARKKMQELTKGKAPSRRQSQAGVSLRSARPAGTNTDSKAYGGVELAPVQSSRSERPQRHLSWRAGNGQTNPLVKTSLLTRQAADNKGHLAPSAVSVGSSAITPDRSGELALVNPMAVRRSRIRAASEESRT